MASASKRLNDRLAKYNNRYEDDDQVDLISTSSGDIDKENMADEAAVISVSRRADSPSVNNSNENNNVIEPERVPVKKIKENVSLHVVNGNGGVEVADSAGSGSMCNGTADGVVVAPDSAGPPKTNNINKREAFLKGGGEVPSGGKYEAPSTKFDPTLRERDGKAEKIEKPASLLAQKSDRIVGGMSDSQKPAPVSRTQSSKSLEGYVGFANLPNQVYRKSVKRGFEFTLMFAGESGLGKSTMINSLFLSELYNAQHPGPSHRAQKTVHMNSTQVLLKESGVQLKLTVVDTPGFGDEVDNTNCWQPLTSYVDSKYEEYLNAESKVNRKTSPDDNRVHCCLYFISPTGHSLKPLDIEVMKRLHEKVNIIPLIAKADSLTPEECRDFKKNILNEIEKNNIRIYKFPDVDDDEENKELKKLKDRVPFAVVGSNKVMEVSGKKMRGRQYPWGTVDVDNLVHNDFLALRDMLIRTHMQDLKDVTNNVHYENFRYKKLANVSATDGGKHTDSDPLTQMENEKGEHKLKMKKMEAEMEQVFEMKVKEKMQKLKDSEVDLARRAEQMKKSLEQQEQELNEKRRAFEQEKSAWESQYRQQEQDIISMKGKKKGMFN